MNLPYLVANRRRLILSEDDIDALSFARLVAWRWQLRRDGRVGNRLSTPKLLAGRIGLAGTNGG